MAARALAAASSPNSSSDSYWSSAEPGGGRVASTSSGTDGSGDNVAHVYRYATQQLRKATCQGTTSATSAKITSIESAAVCVARAAGCVSGRAALRDLFECRDQLKIGCEHGQGVEYVHAIPCSPQAQGRWRVCGDVFVRGARDALVERCSYGAR